MAHQSISPRPVFLSRLRVACAALLLGATVAFTASGCVAVAAAGAAGAGVAWIRGALEVNLDDNLDDVYRATQKAIRGLEFAIIDERKSGVDATVVARTALDKRVEVILKRVGDKTTRVSIRVDVFGDEALSHTILERIKSRL
ncbi:MAG: hypothetical protein C0502_04605 [Opitutus sp.]|nr:hypothetical protein [Opitutus sp.]